MGDAIVTNVDISTVIFGDAEFRDELLIFGGLDVFADGTLLARQDVDIAITPAADVGNTGNGTCTAATVQDGPVVPIPGTYVLTCITAVANGGVFKLEDPNGALLSNTLTMTAGVGAATVFELAGLKFTLTDGATDFAAGDIFNLPVVSNGKITVFNPAGAGGAQKIKGVLTNEISRATAGNEPFRMMVSGKVRKNRLIIDVDGDGDNITDAILDQLRGIGITPVDVPKQSKLDNQ